jgi:hypothetical protein
LYCRSEIAVQGDWLVEQLEVDCREDWKMVLSFVAVVVGVVLFEATMVMTTTLCGECFTPRKSKPSYGFMWSGARSAAHVESSTNGAEARKDLLQ